jgi:CubicO group peptidase (beta-lactamase class C family)
MRRVKLSTAALAGAGIILSGAAAGEDVVAGMSRERLARLDDHFHAYVDAGEIAGVVTHISRHGQIVHQDAYGFADIGTRRQMTEDSYFYIYSMTKPVTSVALLILYEEGKFQLTEPIARYLPELANARVFDREAGRVVDAVRQPTIEDVFRHTAGYLYGPQGDTDFDRSYREANLLGSNLAEFSQKLGQLPLGYQPGTRWVYSVSHDVQARLVEVLSGQPFDEFVQERILEPLGMTETVFGRPERLKDQFAVIYTENESGALVPNGALDAPGMATRVLGGFSLSSTASDYARFAEMLVNNGELDGVRILSRKTVDLMASNHLPDGVTRGAAGGGTAGGEGYGLGVRVVIDPAKAGNLTSAGVFGWSGAAGTHFFVDREEGLVGVFMIQKMGGGGPRMSAEFETLVYQALVD